MIAFFLYMNYVLKAKALRANATNILTDCRSSAPNLQPLPVKLWGVVRHFSFLSLGVSISRVSARCKISPVLSMFLRETPLCKGQRPDTYGTPTTLHRELMAIIAGIVAIKSDDLEYSLWAGMPEQYPMKG